MLQCTRRPSRNVSLNIWRPTLLHGLHAHPPTCRVTVRAPGFATIRGVVDTELQDLSRLSSSL